MLRELTASDLQLVEPWFAEYDTQRWLGDQAWPRQLLRHVALSADRFGYAALQNGVVVGMADVERYRDGRVAPGYRRLGVGTAMAGALTERPELADVIEFIAGVEEGNLASAALMTRAGFQKVTDETDANGFTYFALRRNGRPSVPWTLPQG
jgi:RimJ/RimL family protein N-acetyltransferase